MKKILCVTLTLVGSASVLLGAYFGPRAVAHAMNHHTPVSVYYRDPVRVAEDLTRANHTTATRGGSFVADVPLNGSEVIGAHNAVTDR